MAPSVAESGAPAKRSSWLLEQPVDDDEAEHGLVQADRAADRQNHLQIAQIKEDTERMKLGAAIAHAHQEQQNQQPGLSPPSVP